MEKRENKITHELKKDIHERDKQHIIDSYNAACSLVKQYNWDEIKCVENNTIKSIEDIHEEIWSKIKNYI